MIKPSVGRVLWFHPHMSEGHTPLHQPHAATIAHVIDDHTVNLSIVNESGAPYSRQAVQLLQDDDVPPAQGHFAQWMPYQTGQAAKTEQLATQVSPGVLEQLNGRIDELARKLEERTTAAAAAPPLAPQTPPETLQIDAQAANATDPQADTA